LKGVYTLVIFLKTNTSLKIGKLGIHTFPRGIYTYTGSAMGMGALSLEGRIKRHLRKNKKMKWHIDYLLNSDNAQIQSVIYAETSEKFECKVSQEIEKLGIAHVLVKRFGASDCKEGCQAHLHYLTLAPGQVQELILKIYRKLGLEPKLFCNVNYSSDSSGICLPRNNFISNL